MDFGKIFLLLCEKLNIGKNTYCGSKKKYYFEIKTDFDIPKNCKIIDTSETDVAILLISSIGHFVINRFATKKEINKIIDIDK